MLKRVLAQQGVESDSDQENRMSSRHRKRLENKFIAGAAAGRKRVLRGAGTPAQKSSVDSPESEEEEDESDAEDESVPDGPLRTRASGGTLSTLSTRGGSRSKGSSGPRGVPDDPRCLPADHHRVIESDDTEDEGGDSSDNDDLPLWPAACEVEEAREVKRRFHCELCAEKLFKSEVELEQHLKSAKHLKIAETLLHAREVGYEQFRRECAERARKRDREFGSGAEKRAAKKDKYLSKMKDRRERRREQHALPKAVTAGENQATAGNTEKAPSPPARAVAGKSEKNEKKKSSEQIEKKTASIPQPASTPKQESGKTSAASVPQKRPRLSEEEWIAAKKAKFASKKARRLARKQPAEEGSEESD